MVGSLDHQVIPFCMSVHTTMLCMYLPLINDVQQPVYCCYNSCTIDVTRMCCVDIYAGPRQQQYTST